MKNRVIKIYYPKTIYAFNEINDYYLLDNSGITEFSFSPYIIAVIDKNKDVTYLKKVIEDEHEFDRPFNIPYDNLNEDDKNKVDSIINIVDEKYDEITQQPRPNIPPII